MEDQWLLILKNHSIERLVVGESFAPKARECLEEIWDVDTFNTYGSRGENVWRMQRKG